MSDNYLFTPTKKENEQEYNNSSFMQQQEFKSD